MALFLVTGGCGFIGSNLTHALLARGERVRIVDDLSTGYETNVAALFAKSGEPGPRPRRSDALELIHGDITDGSLLDRALLGVDYVLHHAAIPSVPWSIARPLECDRVNGHGTLQVLEAVRRSGRVKRLVFAASCAVYGDPPADRPQRESDLPAPLSPYAISKLFAEHLCVVYHRLYGVPTVALRYFNIFGPRQDPASTYSAAIPRFVSGALTGEELTVYGDGLQSRDFCFVDNVVAANLLACSTAPERVAGRVFNIGGGQAVTLLDVLHTIGELLGRRLKVRHEAARSGDVRHSRADLTLATELLQYRPQIDLRQGLEQTLRWFRDRAALPSQMQTGVTPCAA